MAASPYSIPTKSSTASGSDSSLFVIGNAKPAAAAGIPAGTGNRPVTGTFG